MSINSASLSDGREIEFSFDDEAAIEQFVKF